MGEPEQGALCEDDVFGGYRAKDPAVGALEARRECIEGLFDRGVGAQARDGVELALDPAEP